MKSIANLETLKNLIYYREIAEIGTMKDLVQKKMFEEGKSYFDIWQFEVSDEIQSLAMAFGERYHLEHALDKLSECKHEGAGKALEAAIFLHCVNVIRENISWYLINGIVSTEAAAELDAVCDGAVKAFVPYMNDVVEGLGLPQITHLHAPVSRDYVAFND
jgi:hypothetical protein